MAAAARITAAAVASEATHAAAGVANITSETAIAAATARIETAAAVASEAATTAAGVASTAAGVAAETARQAVAVAAEAAKGTVDLTEAVRNLTITSAELRVTVKETRERAEEDRVDHKTMFSNIFKDVSELQKWKARIQGQLVILSTLFGAAGGALISHLITGHP